MRPRLIGDGSPVFSTSRALIPFPPIIWDTNGYYRLLGVSTNASRKEIKNAYISLNGHKNDYLTFVTIQLLNTDVRAAYDATPLGSVFMDDYLKRDIAKRLFAQKRSFQTLDIDPKSDLDGGAEDGQDEFLSHPLRRVDEWCWSHYLWGDTDTDCKVLREWQNAIIEALAGEQYQLAIGLMEGQGQPWVVTQIGYRIVVFLDKDAAPTHQLALAAANKVRTINGIS